MEGSESDDPLDDDWWKSIGDQWWGADDLATDFDEEFVNSAKVKEPTAAELERARRQANLRRMLEEEQAESSADDQRRHEYRRHSLPPEYFDEFGDFDMGGYGYDGDFGADPGDGGYALVQLRRRRRGRAILSVLAVVVVVAVVVLYGLSHFVDGSASSRRQSTTASRSGAAASAGAAPRDGIEQGTRRQAALARPAGWPSEGQWSPAPLGNPPAAPSPAGAYSFEMMQPTGDAPVTYDPCREIHYVTYEAASAPTEATRLLKDAIATVSALTGLVFADDGPTDEAPSDDRKPFQPDRYGDVWAPVLIAWSNPKQSPALRELIVNEPSGDSSVDILGYAGSVSAGFTTGGESKVDKETPKSDTPGSGADGLDTTASTSDSNGARPGTGAATKSPEGKRIYVTGSLVLDTPDIAQMLTRFDGYAQARATILHELGHLVGLGHVDDTSQLMAPVLSGRVTEFGSGDRAGLAELGSGACVPEI